MNVHRTTQTLRDELAAARRTGRSIAFVPTMGALHEGHLSLVRAAQGLADLVVMSIFVNPLQFGPNEDYQSYPRDERRDLELAEEAGVDVAFIPTVEEMYPVDAGTTVKVGGLADVAEGAARPGHFDGVATVVVKLFNAVQPRWAVFGQKDAQQVAVIRQVVRDLAIPVEIVVAPTVRDRDGLALSSRNAYLHPEQRRSAPALYRALQEGETVLRETGSIEGAEKTMRERIEEAGLELEYALVVDPRTFGSPDGEGARLLIVAARAGHTRLIDNVPYEPERLEV